MTEEAFAQALHTMCGQRPFRLFFLEFVTNQRLLVVHPEAVVLRGKVWMHYSSHKQHHLFDSSSVCRVLYPGRD